MDLNQEELAVLDEALDVVLQGMSEAGEEMVKDTATLNDLDTFNETMGEHQHRQSITEGIRRKVQHERHVD